jgi:uncharacterized protein (TIGR02145 family)
MEITGANNGRTITVKANAVNTYAASAITVQAKNACGASGPQVSLQTITVRDCSAAPATPTLSVTATTINRTGTATLSCTDVGNGATSYTWTLPSGLTGSSTTNTIVITGATAGTYQANTISVKATNDCGYTTATGSGGAITVRDCSAAPATPTLSVTATTINRTGTTTLSCTDVGNGATTYAWTLPSGLTGSSTTNTIEITGATAGTYQANTISVKATNDCGNTTATGSGGAITVRDCSAAPTISLPATDETRITKQGVALPADLSVSANVYGASVVTFRWEKSTNLSTWNPIESATNAAYTAPVTEAGTVYYRCVVNNGCGSATSKIFTVNVCGTSIQDEEENWYCTGNFGTAGTWMTMNLRTKSNLTENGAPGTDTSNKYYWYPGQDSDVSATTADDILDVHPEYGLLYTWAAATDRTGVTGNEANNSGQTQYPGICPSGWHLPSDYEWNQLEEVIAKDAANVYSTTGATTWNASYSTDTGWRGTHSTKMKSRTAVDGQTTGGTSNGHAANGFDALLVGAMSKGSASGYGTAMYFWSSSSFNSSYAWRQYLYYDYPGVDRSITDKHLMSSVRCKKNECTAAPTISSPASDETRITKTGEAVSALSVTAEGKGATPTFQWQSSANLSTWDPIESATGDTFTAPVANAGTTHYRCVVSNDCGSATSKVFTVNVCGASIQDSEGNWYCTGDFGTAGTWMTMNLRTRSNVPASANSDNSNSAYYYYPGGNQTIFTSHPEYGLLYTWAAANIGTSATEGSDAFSGTVSTRQGICPAGWHLPSDYEWTQLTDVISASADGVYSTTTGTGNVGTKMKSRTAVDDQTTGGTSNGPDANGFDALLVGRMYSGSADAYGTYKGFWSSSSGSNSNAWYRILTHNTTEVYRNSTAKYYMYSVRCKKN